VNCLRCVTADEIDGRDVFFDSFQQDYPGFDEWFGKCQRDQRIAWIVDRGCQAGTARVAGLCLVHAGNAHGYGWPGRALKICSLKVDLQGGEALGKILVQKAVHHGLLNACGSVFCEVLPRHARLIALLMKMGFSPQKPSGKGEMVLRRLLPTVEPLP